MLGDLFKAATDVFGMSEDYKARKQADKQFKSNQREAIQWRVKDAKAAGIHPLFALGASVGSSPTTHVGTSGAGQAARQLGETVKGIGDKRARAEAEALSKDLIRAQINSENASASRDTAEAMYTDAQRAHLGQKLVAQGNDLSAITYPYPDKSIAIGDVEYIKPPQELAKAPGVVAGTHPATQDWMMPDGSIIRTWANAMQMDELKQFDVFLKWQDGLLKKDIQQVKNAFKKLGIKMRQFTPKGNIGNRGR